MEIDAELDEKFAQKYAAFMAAVRDLPVMHRERIALANASLHDPDYLRPELDELSKKMKGKFLDDMESFDEDSSDAFILRTARGYRPNAMKFHAVYDAWSALEDLCRYNPTLMATLARRHELLVEV